MSHDRLRIEPEFAELLSPLSKDEYAGLKADIERHGCLDSIVVSVGTEGLADWTILDGHNRYRICQETGKPLPSLKSLIFATRAEAFNWVIEHQLARRNLAPEQASYLRGRRYRQEKKAHGGDRLSQKVSTAQNEQLPKETRVKLAEELGVSKATIQRDAAFAEGVDALAAEGGKEVKDAILTGKSGLTKGEVQHLAKATDQEQKEAAENIKAGRPLAAPAADKGLAAMDRVCRDLAHAAEGIVRMIGSGEMSPAAAEAIGLGIRAVHEALSLSEMQDEHDD